MFIIVSCMCMRLHVYYCVMYVYELTYLLHVYYCVMYVYELTCFNSQYNSLLSVKEKNQGHNINLEHFHTFITHL